MKNFDIFTTAYITCALWSTTDNADETGGEPLDRNYSIENIAPETLARMEEDCLNFQADNKSKLEIIAGLCDSARAGHNFWLNRNGHGSGFWDEYYGADKTLCDAFDNLSAASKAWGAFDLYIGDDKKIYGS